MNLLPRRQPTLVQNDYGFDFEIDLVDEQGQLYDGLSRNDLVSVTLLLKHPNKVLTQHSANVVTPAQNDQRNPYIRYTIQENDLSDFGEWKFQVVIQFSNAQLTSKEQMLMVFPDLNRE